MMNVAERFNANGMSFSDAYLATVMRHFGLLVMIKPVV